MSQTSAALSPTGGTADVTPIPLREIAPWALLLVLLASLVVFFISADQGAISIPSGTAVHEWVHDGRHLLGFPCH